MTVCGIIAEFNPLHNGHAHLLEQARILTGADYLVVVMSGDFMQRGEPACMDKYCRTKLAIAAGADAVFELPSCIATGSAQYFARGAIAALDSLGIVDYLCFGSESGNLEELKQKADSSVFFPDDKLLNTHSRISGNRTSLELSNNILAMEYLKALQYFNSKIIPVTIRRETGYYEQCSAFGLRNRMKQDTSGTFSSVLSGMVPEYTLPFIDEYYETHRFMDFDDLSDILFYRLLESDKEDLVQYFDIYPDLAAKICNGFHTIRPALASAFREQLKSREIAFSHISRALLHIVLSLKTSDIELLRAYNYCAYLRLLGFCESSRPLMQEIKKKATKQIVTKLADAGNVLSEEQLYLFNKDLFASDLYEQLSAKNKKTAKIPGEYRQPVIISSHNFY
ncbi:MAG: nucleotidyltransferase family protein [Lachnospiraceae bacterium]